MVVQSLECMGSDRNLEESPDVKRSTRRASARIQLKQRAEKEVLVRRRVELLDDREDGRGGGTKKRTPSSNHTRRSNGPTPIAVENGPTSLNLEGKSDHAKVKETLRLFNKHYLNFVQVSHASFQFSFLFS